MQSRYQDLIVWQKAMDLAEEIYRITKTFPQEERYALTDQMRRSAVSIPSNIAEGSKRGTKEFCQFLRTAQGSGAELETQILLSYRFGYISEEQTQKLQSQILEILKMLSALQTSLLGTRN